MAKQSFFKRLVLDVVKKDVAKQLEIRLEQEKVKWAEDTAEELVKKN